MQCYEVISKPVYMTRLLRWQEKKSLLNTAVFLPMCANGKGKVIGFGVHMYICVFVCACEVLGACVP